MSELEVSNVIKSLGCIRKRELMKHKSPEIGRCEMTAVGIATRLLTVVPGKSGAGATATTSSDPELPLWRIG